MGEGVWQLYGNYVLSSNSHCIESKACSTLEMATNFRSLKMKVIS